MSDLVPGDAHRRAGPSATATWHRGKTELHWSGLRVAGNTKPLKWNYFFLKMVFGFFGSEISDVSAMDFNNDG